MYILVKKEIAEMTPRLHSLKFRAGDHPLKLPDQLRLHQQRAPMPAPRSIRAGDKPSNLDSLLSLRQRLSLPIRLVTPADSIIVGIVPASPRKPIIIPEMGTLTPKLSIMRGEVPAGLFRQVMQGYEIRGQNGKELLALLNDPEQADKPIRFVSLQDARIFARNLSLQTGRNFRVQSETDFFQATHLLSGELGTWTETETIPGKEIYFICLRERSFLNHSLPHVRYSYVGIRLVEYTT